RPQNAGEGYHRDGRVQDHQGEGKRVNGERLDVLGDALVGVVDVLTAGQPLVGAVGEVSVDQQLRQALAQQQAEPFLDVALAGRHQGDDHEHAGVDDGERPEPPDLPFRQRRHEVVVDVAVADV